MVSNIANFKQLITEFFNKECDFSKVLSQLKRPMLVKVFRSAPMFLINDKQHYMHGYFTTNAINKFRREYGFGLDDMKGKSLKINKFKLTLSDSNDDSCVSYMNKEVKLIIEDCSVGRHLERGTDVNKFVVNVCRDNHIKLVIASYLHREFVKSSSHISFAKFMINEMKQTHETVLELTSQSQADNDEKFKSIEIVTCIVGSDSGADTSKQTSKRVLKGQLKDDQLYHEQHSHPVKRNRTKQSKPKSAQNNKRIRQSNKPETLFDIKPKKIDFEADKSVGSVSTLEPKMLQDIKDILIKTDFLLTKDKSDKKAVKKLNKRKMNIFKDYMNWYDNKCSQMENSDKSQRCSTGQSTPQKSCINAIERMKRL